MRSAPQGRETVETEGNPALVQGDGYRQLQDGSPHIGG